MKSLSKENKQATKELKAEHDELEKQLEKEIKELARLAQAEKIKHMTLITSAHTKNK